jgi:predicted Zn-dependent protease
MILSEFVSRIIKGENSPLQWDLYSQRASDTEVHFRENKIESFRSPILSEGFAVRVIRKKKSQEGKNDESSLSGIGIAPGNLLSNEKNVIQATKFALEASKYTSAPEYDLPSDKSPPTKDVKIVDEQIESDQEGSTKELSEQVISLLGGDPKIRVTFCKIRLTKIETTLENCFGLHLEKTETFAYFEVGLSPKSKELGLAEYWPRVLCRRIEDLHLEREIPKWSKYALDAPKAEAPETGSCTLIVPPHVLSEMAPPIVSFHASASTLRKGMSLWKEKGQKVWSDKITISDDGLVDYSLGTSPFDDEGTPQQATSLIRNGEFQNYIANNMYPDTTSTKSSGNGVKNSRSGGTLCYSDDVGLHDTNIVMKGGDSGVDEMIRETKHGLLMEQFSWMLPDPMTGTFGAEIRHAYLVENGEVQEPIKGGVVNGSFFDGEGSNGKVEQGVFSCVDLISRETMLGNSSVLPYVRFPEIRVSGR